MLRLSGYTAAEKQHIGRQYLEKQAAGEAGVPDGAVQISDEAMSHLIVEYCRSATLALGIYLCCCDAVALPGMAGGQKVTAENAALSYGTCKAFQAPSLATI